MKRRDFLAGGPLGLAASAALHRPLFAAQTAPREPGLKITAVEPWILKTGTLLVLLRTSEGLTGIGECSPMNIRVIAAMIEQALAPKILGRNPLDINLLWEAMFYSTYKLGVMGIQPEAIAGIDIALWDLFGKVTRQPLHRLLGGRRRERVRMYASIGGGASTSIEDMARRASEAVSRGFTAIKIRMDWGNQRTDVRPEQDWQLISTVRRVVGSKIDLGFDPNNGYSVSTAIRMGRRLQDQLGIVHYEEPVPQHDYRGLAQVAAALDMPVAAGEQEYTLWQFRDLIEVAQVDIVQPDLVKCAGITEAVRIAALAAAHDRILVPHQTQPSVGNTANLHFTAAFSRTENPQEFNYDMEKAEALRKVFPNMPVLEKGHMTVPDGPGLGLTLDEAELARLRA